jgi:NAD(P)-dependent dehydrogenase (short-subunit alcohol dehydrogenase family)
MDFGLKDKAVLVTGGNRGIGLAIALAFAEEGADVAICGRDPVALDSAATTIADRGVRAKSVTADLFTPEGCQLAIETTAETFGRLDVLVNNASTDVSGTLETTSDEILMERVMGKTLASMRCCRAALPYLRASGRGRIICIGGTSARTPAADSLPSGLSNASLVNFARHMSLQVAADGITVNVVHPSFTKTERHAGRMAARAKDKRISVAEAEQSMASAVPIGRMIEPADIAPLVLFLASAQASALTGQTIAVDGGATPSVVY